MISYHSQQVPIQEQSFLSDQRTVRRMGIGKLDIKETTKLKIREERKFKAKEYYKVKQSEMKMGEKRKISNERDNDIVEFGNNNFDLKDFNPEILSTSKDNSEQKQNEKPGYNIMKLNTVAQVCDRYGLSDRAAAAITSAVLQDVGLISESNKNSVIDRSKIRRARINNRISLQKELKEKSIQTYILTEEKIQH